MPTPRLAILLSGSGTTLQNFLDRRARGQFDADIAVVIASRPDAYGLGRAQNAGLPTAVETHSGRVFDHVRAANVDLVVLAGWMRLLTIPPDYALKVLNIHPSLLPAFGGRGMYGMRVHEAVHASGVKVTGCTVHFADASYDTGPIVAQSCVAVDVGDSPADIAAKVAAAERELYAAAVLGVAAGGWRLEGRRFVAG